MGQFRDVTIKEVVEEINQSYFLPDIQREYVWLNRDKERKIEQLFDSVLRNYPIGSFLFWKLKKTDIETNRLAQSDEDKLNFQLYKFLEEYDIRKPHNEKIDIAKVNTSDLTIVLDGQQRLTSLYIGLKGSRTLKKPKGWWENPNSFEAKKLYLNLRYKPADNDAEDCYDFEFKNPSYIPEPDEKNYWFRVGEILEIDSVIKYCRDHSLSDAEADILEKLKNVLCVERLISYYEEREKNLDKVLKIFIRVNSGGTQLSYSDLLMSILTANFSSDIRDVMNSFVDKIREDGFPCFGRDQLLKTCLLLTGANHKFALKNFRKANVEAIEAAWPSIMDRICEALSIVKGFGYSRQLASGYIVSVIALYLYNSEKSIKDIDKVSEEREAIWDFVRLAQITSYFSTSLDSKLSNVVECMAETLSFVDFKEKMARLDANKALKLTSEDVEDLLTVQYGSPAALPVLQMLYPHLDYKNSTFHVDHIYPKSKFTPRNKYLDPKHYEERNYLFNLQLLEGHENTSKRDADPNDWLLRLYGNDEVQIESYKEKNYISKNFSLEWSSFSQFKEARMACIKQALIKILRSSI